jgi:hypothetical protein
MWGIIVFIFGMVALVKGQFYLTRNRVVGRAAARVIGLLLMLPLPMHYLARFLLGGLEGKPGARGEEETVESILVSIAAFWIPIFLALGIAVMKAERVKKKNLPPEQPYFDDRGSASSSPPTSVTKEDRIRPPEDKGLHK